MSLWKWCCELVLDFYNKLETISIIYFEFEM
jgi:hypothetical protein